MVHYVAYARKAVLSVVEAIIQGVDKLFFVELYSPPLFFFFSFSPPLLFLDGSALLNLQPHFHPTLSSTGKTTHGVRAHILELPRKKNLNWMLNKSRLKRAVVGRVMAKGFVACARWVNRGYSELQAHKSRIYIHRDTERT